MDQEIDHKKQLLDIKTIENQSTNELLNVYREQHIGPNDNQFDPISEQISPHFS